MIPDRRAGQIGHSYADNETMIWNNLMTHPPHGMIICTRGFDEEGMQAACRSGSRIVRRLKKEP